MNGWQKITHNFNTCEQSSSFLRGSLIENRAFELLGGIIILKHNKSVYFRDIQLIDNWLFVNIIDIL